MIDEIFTFIPAVLSIYHLRGLTRRSVYHSNHTMRILLCFVVSSMLKLCFKIERPHNGHENSVDGILSGIMHLFTSKYAFPSTHSMFYTQYFMYNMSMVTFLLGTAGIFSRVFYKHHTPLQAFVGFCFALFLEVSLFSHLKITKKTVIEGNWIKFKMKQDKGYSAKLLKTLKICAIDTSSISK